MELLTSLFHRIAPQQADPLAQCPSCQHVLETMPKARRKCPACRAWIYLKRRPTEEHRQLVTAEEAQRIEGEWQAHYKKLVVEDRRRADQRWGDLNRQLVEAMKIGDWGSMKQLYFEQAFQLWREGKSFFRAAQESRRSELRSYEQSGISEVDIFTCREESCEACRVSEGKRFTIKQALEEMPIPLADCMSDIGEFGQKQGRCRCMYGPIFDGGAR